MSFLIRLPLVVIVALVLSACGGSNGPTAPTSAPVAVAPPPVPLPPPAPPPPVVTNYAGRWIGEYVVEQCGGSSGSMDDILCSAPRGGNPGGVFQRGVRLPVLIELTQSGTSVNGALSLGQIRGPVSGSVINQRLILSGTIIYSDASVGLTVTSVITNWDSSIVSDLLSGRFSLNVRVNVLPGDGVVSVLLQNTMRR